MDSSLEFVNPGRNRLEKPSFGNLSIIRDGPRQYSTWQPTALNDAVVDESSVHEQCDIEREAYRRRHDYARRQQRRTRLGDHQPYADDDWQQTPSWQTSSANRRGSGTSTRQSSAAADNPSRRSAKANDDEMARKPQRKRLGRTTHDKTYDDDDRYREGHTRAHGGTAAGQTGSNFSHRDPVRRVRLGERQGASSLRFDGNVSASTEGRDAFTARQAQPVVHHHKPDQLNLFAGPQHTRVAHTHAAMRGHVPQERTMSVKRQSVMGAILCDDREPTVYRSHAKEAMSCEAAGWQRSAQPKPTERERASAQEGNVAVFRDVTTNHATYGAPHRTHHGARVPTVRAARNQGGQLYPLDQQIELTSDHKCVRIPRKDRSTVLSDAGGMW